MLKDLKSFKKDWLRWSPREKATAVAVLFVAGMGLLGRVADTII